MQRFTDAVRDSLAARNWYSALSLALTLPDICGTIDTPTELSSQKRYAAWFDTWLSDLYTQDMSGNGDMHIFMSGTDCYALRCALLHQGVADIDGKAQLVRDALSRFIFTTPPQGGSNHCNQINRTLMLQVDIFCNHIADAVDRWSAKHQGGNGSKFTGLITIHDASQGISFPFSAFA